MSQTRRSDLRANSDVTYTDDAGKFKKAFQTVGRPEVTKDDIHEEYMRHPPNNQPTEPMSDRRGPGKKEGAWEVDDTAPEEERVLGEEALGKQTKESALQETVEEDSLHANNTV